MGRKRKQGFSYFPLDVDFFSDIKIRKLIKNNSSQAVSIYLCVLTLIYENGYYVVNDRDLGFVISEKTGCKESMVNAVLSYCVAIGLFSDQMYKQGVFTSESIQYRYFQMCKSSKRTIAFTDHVLISSEEMAIISEKMAINPEKMQQSKVNKISFLEKKKQKIYIGDSEQKSEKEDFSEPQDEKTQVETQKEKRKKVAPKKEKENKPQISEFLNYCKDLIEKKQLGDFSALKFGLEAKYNQWAQNNWRDGYNEPIKNWKTKIQNTIPHIKPIKNATNTITNSYNQPQGQKTAFRSILAQQLSQSTASNPSTGSQAIDVEAVIVE